MSDKLSSPSNWNVFAPTLKSLDDDLLESLIVCAQYELDYRQGKISYRKGVLKSGVREEMQEAADSIFGIPFNIEQS